jgi:hypothetical protein
VGKHRFRIREHHLAAHLAPLIRDKAVGAAKLDLVLRGIALPPAYAGARTPGTILPKYSWEQLHDLARVPTMLGSSALDIDAPPDVVRLKRKWLGVQLARLEKMNLLQREHRPGRRPRILLLADDGSGRPFDDPDGTPGNTYVTIPGSVIASERLAAWGGPELAFFLAAMLAESDAARQSAKGVVTPGGGKWFRPLSWFADLERLRSAYAIRVPLAVPTLERGLALHEKAGLVAHTHITHHPRTGRRLQGPRNLYIDRFDVLENVSSILDEPSFAQAVQDLLVDADEADEDDQE